MSPKTTRQGQRWGQADARIHYLFAVSRCVPEAIDALMALDVENEDVVRAWAEQWGFVDAWARETARAHARLWRACPQLAGRWCSASGNPQNMRPLETPIWDPAFESESAFRNRVEAYIRTVKKTAALPVLRTGEMHFEWLALAHVARQRQGDIAARYGNVSESAISQALKKTSRLVGITHSAH